MMEINKIYFDDYLNIIDKLPDKFFKLAILDPPYNINADSWDNIPDYLNWMQDILIRTQEKITEDGALYLWGTIKNNDFLKMKIFMDEDFKMEYRNWIVWIKEMKIHRISKKKLNTKHEDLLFYAYPNHDINLIRDNPTETQLKIHKGKYDSEFFIERDNLPPSQQKQFKKGLHLGSQIKSWWKGPSNTSAMKPAKLKKFMGYKSVWVSERIISLSSNENDNILIPFAGTGTECVAAKNLNRNFIATEIDKIHFDIANDRLNGNLTEMKEDSHESVEIDNIFF